VARWRAPGYAGTEQLSVGEPWVWATRAGLDAFGLNAGTQQAGSRAGQGQRRTVESGTGAPEGGSVKALTWARDRFKGSLAQNFLARLKALDFAGQAMLFGAGLLASLLPFVILLSAFASRRVDAGITLRLGLDHRASWTSCSRPRRPR